MTHQAQQPMFESTLIFYHRASYLLTAIMTIALAAFLLLRKRHEPHDALSVSVHDAYASIPPEVMRRLAEPFVTSKPHGTGLGLPIVQTIVRAHGGRVIFQNLENEGTAVRVWLPMQSRQTNRGRSHESA